MANNPRGRIPAPHIRPDLRPLRFSFKYLDTDHQKFGMGKWDAGFLGEFLCCLKKFSGWQVDHFQDQHNNERRHTIDFEATTEKGGFSNLVNLDPDQMGAHEPWQFAVRPDQGEKRWRVHGVLIDDTFYVVWLDLEHLLYP